MKKVKFFLLAIAIVFGMAGVASSTTTLKFENLTVADGIIKNDNDTPDKASDDFYELGTYGGFDWDSDFYWNESGNTGYTNYDDVGVYALDAGDTFDLLSIEFNPFDFNDGNGQTDVLHVFGYKDNIQVAYKEVVGPFTSTGTKTLFAGEDQYGVKGSDWENWLRIDQLTFGLDNNTGESSNLRAGWTIDNLEYDNYNDGGDDTGGDDTGGDDTGGDDTGGDNNPVPEPGTFFLLGFGVIALGGIRRRFLKK